jgi:antitoxin YefM
MRTENYTNARAHLAEVLNSAVEDREEVIITRAGREPAVVVALAEYQGLKETDYLLRNPANREHLRRAIGELDAGRGEAHGLAE